MNTAQIFDMIRTSLLFFRIKLNKKQNWINWVWGYTTFITWTSNFTVNELVPSLSSEPIQKRMTGFVLTRMRYPPRTRQFQTGAQPTKSHARPSLSLSTELYLSIPFCFDSGVHYWLKFYYSTFWLQNVSLTVNASGCYVRFVNCGF